MPNALGHKVLVRAGLSGDERREDDDGTEEIAVFRERDARAAGGRAVADGLGDDASYALGASARSEGVEPPTF